MGWDLGGANLKACVLQLSQQQCELRALWHVPCELWRGLEHLDAAINKVHQKSARLASIDAHAVTMTGELVDLFTSRAQGVQQIGSQFVDAIERTDFTAAYGIGFYAMPDSFVPLARLRSQAQAVMSANWHATASWMSQQIPDGVLLDIGSTTTDIIAWRKHRLQVSAATDFGRLSSGQLVYTGATRTPLMAVLQSVRFGRNTVAVAAEYFATMADAYRLLGDLPASAARDTADGRPASVSASARRIARMIGLDVNMHELPAWRRLARQFADAQQSQIEAAVHRVCQHANLPMDAPFVVAGSGGFIAQRIARAMQRRHLCIGQLIAHPGFSDKAVAAVAPALAVAWRAGAQISRDLPAHLAQARWPVGR